MKCNTQMALFICFRARKGGERVRERRSMKGAMDE